MGRSKPRRGSAAAAAASVAQAAAPAAGSSIAAAAPDWSAGSLASVLPSVADRLGVQRYAGRDVFDLPAAARTVVVLVDGLGDELLRQRGGHAPFLRSHLPSAHRVACGFPTTTATSMGSLGTGLLPGAHGLVGMLVLDPDTDTLVNELSWEHGPDPRRWQPHETVFEAVEDAGVAVTMVGPAFFEGSGLTTAALRGGSFRSGSSIDQRVDAAAAAVRAAPRSLVYLYWGDVDKIGHVHGCSSWQWGDEVEAVDAALRRLAALVPDDTSIVVTADHGMVDVPFEARLDLAHEPELMHGIRHLGGEPRCLQLYTEAGERDAVAAVWSQRLGASATVRSREQLVDEGWFGPVRPEVLPRIGDLVVATDPTFAVVHSGLMRPEVVRLLGLHGSTSPAELAVPVIVVPPRRGA